MVDALQGNTKADFIASNNGRLCDDPSLLGCIPVPNNIQSHYGPIELLITSPEDNINKLKALNRAFG